MKTFRIGNNFSSRLLTLACALGLFSRRARRLAHVAGITVQVDKPGAAISPTLFGLFFEDINFGADGGLYPERVKNRSFEFPEPLMGWKQITPGDSKGTLYVLDTGSVKREPTRTTCASRWTRPAGLWRRERRLPRHRRRARARSTLLRQRAPR